MPFLYVRQDITKMRVDAIVNAANETLLGGGGVDGAIHAAAGSGLLQECRTLGGCNTGEAKRTKGYNLPCKYVIHTVGPIWHGGDVGEEELLEACYKNSLQIAADSACESVAFPLISSGVYGYPKDQAIRVAARTIRAFLQTHDMTVYLVLFDRSAVEAAKERFGGLQQYIDDNSVREIEKKFARRNFPPLRDTASRAKGRAAREDAYENAEYDGNVVSDAAYDMSFSTCAAMPCAKMPASDTSSDLDELLQQLDESFSEMLLRKIDEKGMTDAQCYKKANIDRKLFSKIRSNPHYRPSKSTALAFAIALELPLPEVRDMLRKAGYALSRSSKSDVIIEYFLMKGNYDVYEINEALFAFDQSLLGA